MAISAHLINLAVHVGAGIAAMGLGFYMLASPKGDLPHRKRGRRFVALTLVVCATAVIGNAFFRFIPLFAVLTVLVTYQLLSGWHVVHTKSAGPDRVDALLLLCAAVWTVFLVPVLLSAPRSSAPTVIYSSLAALVVMLAYDTARWRFPRPWHATLWRYEHIYKLNAALFAMLSAATGNLIRIGQPWSQLLPIAFGFCVVFWCFWRNYADQVRRRAGDGKLEEEGVPKGV
jgi:uncharacterized membrane protein